MPTPVSVLVVGDVSPSFAVQLERLRCAGHAVHVLSPEPNTTRQQLIQSIKDLPCSRYAALVVMTHLLRPLNEQVIGSLLPRLKFVTEPGAGYDDVDIDFMTQHGIYFANNPQSVSVPTATTATMLILQTVRAASRAEAHVRAGRWRNGLQSTPDIRDLTLGIVGLGTIGKIVQKQVEALGMTVIYNNRRRLPPDDEGQATYVSFDELIGKADVISLHAPLTDETRHMLSDDQFKQMKEGVFIVNTSRGPVIHEEALVRAMQSGKVSRVGLDVYEEEPVVHPWIMESDRCSLLPHWAAATTRVPFDSEKEILANLQAWIATGKPNTPVNEPRL